MKTTITLLLLSACLIGKAQVTTQTEFNYMKKGYRQVEESGLDVKKGYTVEVLGTQNKGDITCTYTLLRRADNSIAGIIVKTVANFSGTNYYCIPAVNKTDAKSYGWDEFTNDFAAMTNGQKNAIAEWMAYRMAYEMSQANKKGN